MSAFMDWAEQQFGKRPPALSVKKVQDLEVAARSARRDLELQREWDRLTNAALYGWSASPTLRKAEGGAE